MLFYSITSMISQVLNCWILWEQLLLFVIRIMGNILQWGRKKQRQLFMSHLQEGNRNVGQVTILEYAIYS